MHHLIYHLIYTTISYHISRCVSCRFVALLLSPHCHHTCNFVPKYPFLFSCFNFKYFYYLFLLLYKLLYTYIYCTAATTGFPCWGSVKVYRISTTTALVKQMLNNITTYLYISKSIVLINTSKLGTHYHSNLPNCYLTHL